MKRMIAFLLLLSGSAMAQEPAPRDKVPEVCKAEAQKFCDGKNLKQECLVTNWTRLSDACQDGLMTKLGR